MKPYFAKCLEGEIKEGYLSVDGLKGEFLRESHVPGKEHKVIFFQLPSGEVYNITSQGSRKTKLVLCSRDIKVGDKDVYTGILQSEGPEIVKELKDESQLRFMRGVAEANGVSLYKVIGEISPEATWVKEGMEFEESELRMVVKGNFQSWAFDPTWDFNKHPLKYILVKGLYGHFH